MLNYLVRRVFLLVLFLCLANCGGGGGGSGAPVPPTVAPPPAPEPLGLWTQGGDGQGLARFKARMSQTSPSITARSDAIEATAAMDAGGFTTTYTLEADIDEHDIVKYDGRILAVAPSRSGCCFVLDAATDALPPVVSNANPSIALYETDSSSGTVRALASVSLEEEEAVEGLYLSQGKLHILMSSAWWGTFGDALIAPENWRDQQVRLLQYDVTAPEAPALGNSLTVEGALLVSRRVGDQLYVVSRHTPAIEGLVPYPQTSEEAATNEAVLAAVEDNDLLPRITVNAAEITPLSLDDCYRTNPDHPLAQTLPADPAITTVLSISADTGEVTHAACSLEPISGVYVSSDSLVFTYIAYADTTDEPEEGSEVDTTLVHQLSLQELDYVGSARVAGRLYSGGMNDFRINAFDGMLRLVTTSLTGDETDRFDHQLFILKPSDEEPELVLLGQLPGDSGDELGKPNEDLYGVRFLGNTAYMVTFERIDPLYVLDLQDPSAPVITGTLEVPGFSDLLHPVSEALLLGVGQVTVEGKRYAKVELFNIDDISAPQSQGAVLLGTPFDHSYSPAQYNRYAFTYRSATDTDRFTVPYAVSGRREDVYFYEGRIAQFEVLNKQDPVAARLSRAGEILLGEFSDVSGDTRVVLDDDAVYVINQGQLWSGLWSNPEAVKPAANR